MNFATLLLVLSTIISLIPGLQALAAQVAQPPTQVQVQNSQQWIMPTSFAFNGTAEFFWPVVGGINLLGMFVRDVKSPAKNLGGLPLGPCAILNVKQNTCSQYVNNGTAQFGGVFARGLTPGEKYFIAVVWIAADSSASGTSSSPSFTMQYPDYPYPPYAVEASNRNPGLSSTVSAIAITTVQLAITQTTLLTVTSSATPMVISTLEPSIHLNSAVSNSTSEAQSNGAKRSATKIPPWAIAIIIIGCIAFILFVACVTCKTLAYLKAQRTEIEKQKHLAIARASVLAQPQTTELRGGDLSELPGHIWDGAHELPGSRGGSEMEGDEIMMRKTLPKSTSDTSVETGDTVAGSASGFSDDSRHDVTGGIKGYVSEIEVGVRVSKEPKALNAQQLDPADSDSVEDKSRFEEGETKSNIASVAKRFLARAKSA